MAESTLEVEHQFSADQWDWPLQHNDGVAKVFNDANHFEVGLEVHFFAPKEIEVKVCGNEIIVHCIHEERADKHGRVRREIFRAYHLPHDVNAQSLKSKLTPQGILIISADKKK